jgi:hypothetical protein
MWDIQRRQRYFLFIQMAAALRTDNQVHETVEVTIRPKITSEATNFIKQVLPFLVYCRGSIMKTLN